MIKKWAVLGFILLSVVESQGVKIGVDVLLSAPEEDRDFSDPRALGVPLGLPSMFMVDFDAPTTAFPMIGKAIQSFHTTMNSTDYLTGNTKFQLDSLTQEGDIAVGTIPLNEQRQHDLLYAKMCGALDCAFRPHTGAALKFSPSVEGEVCGEEYTLRTGHPYTVFGYIFSVQTEAPIITNLYATYWHPHFLKPFFIYPLANTKKAETRRGQWLNFHQLSDMHAQLSPST